MGAGGPKGTGGGYGYVAVGDVGLARTCSPLGRTTASRPSVGTPSTSRRALAASTDWRSSWRRLISSWSRLLPGSDTNAVSAPWPCAREASEGLCGRPRDAAGSAGGGTRQAAGAPDLQGVTIELVKRRVGPSAAEPPQERSVTRVEQRVERPPAAAAEVDRGGIAGRPAGPAVLAAA